MFKFPRHYHIALTAPSGGISPETVTAGKKILEACGCKVSVMPHVFAGGSLQHLAAKDDERISDINAAVADDEIDIIWAVRGGAGALRILDKIDWAGMKKSGKYFAGFSDITAIHWTMAKFGIDRYLAAPMMKYLAENDSKLTANTLFDALCGKSAELQLPALNPGTISGTPLPGNLTVAAALCGTGFLPDTTGKILILEDVGEAPYRIDRTLAQLRLAGAFKNCAGIIFGNFTNCGEVPDIMAILQDFSDSMDCPVFYGLPHGHQLPFYSLCGTQIISVSPIQQTSHAV